MARRRLIGWPAIARYCDLSERQAQRLERDERLPLPVGNNADDPNTIAAYIDELDVWLAARRAQPSRGRGRRRVRRVIARDAG